MYPLAAAQPQSTTIPISRAVEAIGAARLHELGIKGKGVKVAVLDTGVSQDHKMIKPNIIHAESMVEGESPEDANSHGSWVASAIAGVPVQSPKGLLYGVAPETELIIIKVLSDRGSGSIAGVVRGMERAVELGADIVSMSLGSLFGTNLSPDSRTLNELAVRNGVLFVVAVGNAFGPFTVGSPGCAALSIGVGAVGMELPFNGAPATYSSKGPTLDGIIKPNISTYGGNVVAKGLSELLYAAGAHGGYESMAGTCLPASTKILTSPGILKDISAIKIGDIVYSIDEMSGALTKDTVTNKLCNGLRETYSIELSDRVIRATGNHPLFVYSGEKFIWKQVSDLIVGDKVLCLKSISDDGDSVNLLKFIDDDWEFVKLTKKGSDKLRSIPDYSVGFDELKNITISQLTQQMYGTRKRILKKLFDKNGLVLEGGDIEPSSRGKRTNGVMPQNTTVDFCRFYGFMLGDGWITKNRSRTWMVCFASSTDKTMNEYYINLFRDLFSIRLKPHTNKWYYSYSKRAGELLFNLGLKRVSQEKCMGDWIFKLPHEQKKAVIQGVIDADAHTRSVAKNSTRITLELTSRELVYQMMYLCHQVGYSCTKPRIRDRDVVVPSTGKVVHTMTWSIDIHYIEALYGNIEKRRANLSKTNIDYNRFVIKTIKSIEYAGIEEVYDLSIKNNYNFIAEDIVVHNSMATPICSGALALLLSAGVKRDRALMEELFARTGGVFLNTITGWGMLNVEKLLNTARADVVPLVSVLGSMPYMLGQPLFQLIKKPERDTMRIQIIR